MPTIHDLLQLRNRHFFALDLVLFTISAVLSFSLRLETSSFTTEMLSAIGIYLGIALPIRLYCFFRFGMYRRYWQDAGPGELLLAARASLLTGFIIWAAV